MEHCSSIGLKRSNCDVIHENDRASAYGAIFQRKFTNSIEAGGSRYEIAMLNRSDLYHGKSESIVVLFTEQLCVLS